MTFLHFDIVIAYCSAPWIPKLKSRTDSSHFDVHGVSNHADDGPIDTGVWDKHF